MYRMDFLKVGLAMGALFAAHRGAAAEKLATPTGNLPRRPLGKTGLMCSTVGFGGVAAMKLSTEQTVEAITSALELGINYVDVAPSYGDAEKKLGIALEGRRNRVHLACKTLQRTAEGAQRELDQSLQLLKTDRLDVYQFHALDTREELDAILGKGGAMETFLKARDAGVIRFIGVTGHDPAVQAEFLRRFPLDTLMAPVDFIDRFYLNTEVGLMPLALSKGVGILAIKSTMRGQVKDKRTAYRYTLSLPVTLTLPAGDWEEIQFAVDVARRLEPMTEAEWMDIVQHHPELGRIVCRQCGYCARCPEGIDVPLVFRIDGFGRRYRANLARQWYAALPRKVDSCSRCMLCEKVCPFDIQIIDQLAEIHKRYS